MTNLYKVTDVMVVMVSGSRDWNDYDAIFAELRELPEDALIIHGGARGADRITDELARGLGFLPEQYLPDESLPIPQRFHARNDEMLRDATYLLAFWDGLSPGTESVIEKAKARGLPYKIIRA